MLIEFVGGVNRKVESKTNKRGEFVQGFTAHGNADPSQVSLGTGGGSRPEASEDALILATTAQSRCPEERPFGREVRLEARRPVSALPSQRPRPTASAASRTLRAIVFSSRSSAFLTNCCVIVEAPRGISP